MSSTAALVLRKTFVLCSIPAASNLLSISRVSFFGLISVVPCQKPLHVFLLCLNILQALFWCNFQRGISFQFCLLDICFESTIRQVPERAQIFTIPLHIKNYGSDKSLPIPLEYSCRLAFAKAWERDRDMVISDPAQNKACWTSQKSPLLFICVWCGLFSRPLPRHSIIFVIAGDISLPDSGENSLPLPERVDFSCVPIGMSITIRPLPNK